MVDLYAMDPLERGIWLISRPPLDSLTGPQHHNELLVRWAALGSLDVYLFPSDDLLEMLASWCIDPEAMANDCCEHLLIEVDEPLHAAEAVCGMPPDTLSPLPCIEISAHMVAATRTLAHQLGLPEPRWSAF